MKVDFLDFNNLCNNSRPVHSDLGTDSLISYLTPAAGQKQLKSESSAHFTPSHCKSLHLTKLKRRVHIRPAPRRQPPFPLSLDAVHSPLHHYFILSPASSPILSALSRVSSPLTTHHSPLTARATSTGFFPDSLNWFAMNDSLSNGESSKIDYRFNDITFLTQTFKHSNIGSFLPTGQTCVFSPLFSTSLHFSSSLPVVLPNHRPMAVHYTFQCNILPKTRHQHTVAQVQRPSLSSSRIS